MPTKVETLASDPFAIGATILILASNKPGTIQATYDRIGQERQYSVKYVNDTSTVCEDWFRGDEIGVPKPARTRKR